MSRTIDTVDHAIIRLLRQDGRLSDVAIGKEVGKSTNAVRLRRKKLELEGIIERYTIYVADSKSIYSGFYYAIISLNKNNIEYENVLEDVLIREKDVLFCDGAEGHKDYVLYCGEHAENTSGAFSKRLRAMPMVEDVRCIRVSENVKKYSVDPERLIGKT